MFTFEIFFYYQTPIQNRLFVFTCWILLLIANSALSRAISISSERSCSLVSECRHEEVVDCCNGGGGGGSGGGDDGASESSSEPSKGGGGGGRGIGARSCFNSASLNPKISGLN